MPYVLIMEDGDLTKDKGLQCVPSYYGPYNTYDEAIATRDKLNKRRHAFGYSLGLSTIAPMHKLRC